MQESEKFENRQINNIVENMAINLAYLYVFLPLILFLLGWIKWYLAIPGTCVLIYCFFSMCKNTPVFWKPEVTRENIEKILLIVSIIFLWVYLSGIGRFVFQNADHISRNTIFETLVNNKWPVVQNTQNDGVNTPKGLIYYIGFWLPAALVGKIFGLKVGYCFQALWAVIGILLFYYFVCAIKKKVVIWPLIIFIFFSGLDIVGFSITNTNLTTLTNTLHLEWWSSYQFSSFTTQLFWVFNQAIPAWVIILLLYVQKNNRYIVLIFSLSLLTSTLPAVGMIPFVIYFIFSRKYEVNSKSEKILCWVKEMFCFENVIGGGFVGIVSFLYLRANTSSQIVGVDSSNGQLKSSLMLLVIFLILEVGVYALAIYKYQKNNILFYISMVWLCCCPLITVGFGKDFCMRASIPALVILYLMVVDTIQKTSEYKDYITLISIVALLLIGSITSIHEITRTVATTAERYRSGQAILDKSISEDELFKSANFVGDVKNNIFFDYFAK
jgi:hypothetical protein